MKVPLLLSLKEAQPIHSLDMERIYQYVGITRQGFHKALKRQATQHELSESIVSEVLDYRSKKDRRAGSRSLFHNLLIKDIYNIGINRFERLLNAKKMTLAPLRTRIVTTRSCLQSWNYPNLVNGIEIDNINQVVVGDITYLNLWGMRYYLFVLTDLYSARVVGHHLNVHMRTEGALQAFYMWKEARKGNLVGCIAHTDGGGQYFSALYLKALEESGCRPSRAENCLRNGYAEQRNGFIKAHLVPVMKAGNITKLQKEMNRVITEYNENRKQKMLGWLSPIEFENRLLTETERKRMRLYKFD